MALLLVTGENNGGGIYLKRTHAKLPIALHSPFLLLPINLFPKAIAKKNCRLKAYMPSIAKSPNFPNNIPSNFEILFHTSAPNSDIW